MITRCGKAIGCLTLTFLIGCSQVPDGPATVDAEGVVTLDGTPVAGAAVVFVAADGSSNSASALSDPQGKFSLNAFDYKTGAVPGIYRAIVTKNEEVTTAEGQLEGEEAEHAAEGDSQQLGVKNVMPSKYQQPSAELEFTIPESGTKDLKLDLTSN